MSTDLEKDEREGKLQCLRIAGAGALFAYLIPLKGLPLDRELRPQLLEAVTALLHAVRATTGLRRSVWLLLDELHREDAVVEISRHAASWQPEMGMGLFPEEPSPRYWTGEALLDREYSTEMPVLKHTVVGLETEDAGAELACRLMVGRGALIQVLHQEAAQAVVARWYGTLQPTIEEVGLAAYPLYVPLLRLESVSCCSAEQLDASMGGAEVYLRESVEDGGLFVLSRHDLRGALVRAGVVPLWSEQEN